MNRIQRCLGVLATLVVPCSLLPLRRLPPLPACRHQTQARPVWCLAPVVVAGGMPGWQIALIAAGAALFAAVAAVMADRARATQARERAERTERLRAARPPAKTCTLGGNVRAIDTGKLQEILGRSSPTSGRPLPRAMR